MYSYIKGELAEVQENAIVVEVNGLGYFINVATNTLEVLPSCGEAIKVYTYVHVKEDAFDLFGFLTKEDKQLFRLLLGVNGIGPKSALGILSVITTDALRFAVLSNDAKALSKAPGVGAKTASRIILELKDKMKIDELFTVETANSNPRLAPSIGAIAVRNEAIEALVALGYSSQEAIGVIAKVTTTEESTVEELLKQALQKMAFM